MIKLESPRGQNSTRITIWTLFSDFIIELKKTWLITKFIIQSVTDYILAINKHKYLGWFYGKNVIDCKNLENKISLGIPIKYLPLWYIYAHIIYMICYIKLSVEAKIRIGKKYSAEMTEVI